MADRPKNGTAQASDNGFELECHRSERPIGQSSVVVLSHQLELVEQAVRAGEDRRFGSVGDAEREHPRARARDHDRRDDARHGSCRAPARFLPRCTVPAQARQYSGQGSGGPDRSGGGLPGGQGRFPRSQVVANLVDNAIKCSPGGGLVEIDARLEGGLREAQRHRPGTGDTRRATHKNLREILPGRSGAPRRRRRNRSCAFTSRVNSPPRWADEWKSPPTPAPVLPRRAQSQKRFDASRIILGASVLRFGPAVAPYPRVARLRCSIGT
jgi:hypothetical protein